MDALIRESITLIRQHLAEPGDVESVVKGHPRQPGNVA